MIQKIEIERFSLVTPRPFEEVVSRFNSAVGHPDMAEFWRSTRGSTTASELKTMIEKGLGRSGLMMFVEFDHGAVLRRDLGSKAPRNVRLVVGNPLIMKEMAKHVPDAGAYAPVTVLVDERSDGVHVSYDRMSSLLAPYGNPLALKVAQELDHKIEGLLREATA